MIMNHAKPPDKPSVMIIFYSGGTIPLSMILHQMTIAEDTGMIMNGYIKYLALFSNYMSCNGIRRTAQTIIPPKELPTLGSLKMVDMHIANGTWAMQ